MLHMALCVSASAALAVWLTCGPMMAGMDEEPLASESMVTTPVAGGETRRQVQIALGTSLVQVGRYEAAARHLESAVEAGSDDPEVLLCLERALHESGQYAKAAAVLEQARAGGGRTEELDHLLGVAYLRVGRDEDAARILAGKFNTVEARESARLYLGIALARLGRYGEARAQLRRRSIARPQEPAFAPSRSPSPCMDVNDVIR